MALNKSTGFITYVSPRRFRRGPVEARCDHGARRLAPDLRGDFAAALAAARARRRQALTATTVNVHAAKTHLSRLLERGERGERITIARAGKPVAVIAPPPVADSLALPPDDPLLNLDLFGFEGPGEKLTNREIHRIVYGA